jgi:hypothetical protein
MFSQRAFRIYGAHLWWGGGWKNWLSGGAGGGDCWWIWLCGGDGGGTGGGG